MPTPAESILLQRIDALTGQLNSTVTRTDGAAFALTLSLIYQAQQLASGSSAERSDAAAAAVDRRQQLYTPDLVARLGHAVQAGQHGELAMLVSWLETVPTPAGVPAGADAEPALVPLSQAALLSKNYSLLEEIRDSSLSVAA